MNTNDQIHHVQPLIDQVADLIRTGQHPDASPRFKVEATAKYDQAINDKIPPHIIKCAQDIQQWFGQQGIKEWAFLGIQSRSFAEAMEATAQQLPEATAQPKAKSPLRQAGEWHSRHVGRLAMLPNPPLAQIDEHVRYAVACMEADEQ